MTETTKYNRTAVFVAACIGICFFGVSMITLGAVLPELCEALSLSEADATGLTTLLPAGLLAGSLLFGPIVDRFGHKPVLVTCCLLVDAALLAVALGRDAAMLRWAIFAIGLGGGALNGETNAMVTEIYEGARRASRLSLLGVFYGIGALAIPLLLAWLSRSYDYNTVLTGISAVLALGIVFCAVTRFPGAKQPQGFPLREAGKIITHPIMLVVALLLFFQSGVEGITNNWSLMYLDSLGIGITDGRLALTAMLAGLTAARLVQSFLFSRVDARAARLTAADGLRLRRPGRGHRCLGRRDFDGRNRRRTGIHLPGDVRRPGRTLPGPVRNGIQRGPDSGPLRTDGPELHRRRRGRQAGHRLLPAPGHLGRRRDAGALCRRPHPQPPKNGAPSLTIHYKPIL